MVQQDGYDEGVPVASIGECQGLDLDLSSAKKTHEHEYYDLIEGGREPRRGDIIYSRNATVGAAAYVSTNDRFCMGQDVCLITSERQNQRYLVYLLRSPIVLRQIDGLTVGATFKRINVGEIKELIVTCPPAEEQMTIGGYCDSVHYHLETTIGRLSAQLDKLREYRQTLISAAVTGKVAVTTKEAAC